MKTRDALRAALLGSQRKFRSEVIEVAGLRVEVRQPSIKERARILKEGKAQSGDADRMDLAKMFVTAVIACCYDPDTGDKVFEDANAEELLGMPSGSFVDVLGSKALELMNVDEKELSASFPETPSVNTSL